MTDSSGAHLNPDEIELWADGLLPAARSMHLADCADCRTVAEHERDFFLQLARLGRLAPSPDFMERVMAHVRVATPSGGFNRQD
jgi:hypothetical protein